MAHLASVLSRLEQDGIEPSPEADRPGLLRRVFLDLTGLPPTPEELDEFLADSAPDAFERWVDRLLTTEPYRTRYAERMAAANNVSNLADGANLYEKADDAKTPEEKLNYLIAGIIQDVEFRKFARAEGKIFDVENSEIKDALYSFLNMRSALVAIEEIDWAEFEKRAEKQSDKGIKAFLYLKAISALAPAKNSRVQLTEYVIKAEKNIDFIPDKTSKASARITLASLLLSVDNSETIRDIPTAIFSVNEAPDYAEDAFEIRIVIPTRQSHYADYIGANSFKDVFSKLAQNNWTDSQIQALQVKRNGLQAIAQIATAKIVLQNKATLK